jgi:hypothetical protein
MKPKTLALDLEGTIITDAISCFVRPGVRAFLDWAGLVFERIVIYTAVPEHYARQVQEILVEEEDAPGWFAEVPVLNPVEREGAKVKALDVLGPAGSVVLVDDYEGYVLEADRPWWVGVTQFTPHDECESDRELETVRREIERRFLARSEAKVLILGDVHGWWGDLVKVVTTLEPDIVLQVGDFGFFPEQSRYNPREWGLASPVPVHWCDGNHEDHAALARLRASAGGRRVTHEVAPNVFWQDRGSTLTLPDGRVALFMGGADSIDKRLRIEGESWFPGEQISDEDMAALPEGPVDIVISHTAPNRILLEAVNHPDALVRDPARERLDEVLKRYRPSRWYFGHWHAPMVGEADGCKWTALNDMAGNGFYAWLGK